MSGNEEAEGTLDIVGSKALRPSTMGALQTQLATELAIATFASDPIQKIRHILEAYRTLDPERQQEVEPSEEERVKWNMRYEICMSFLGMKDIGRAPWGPMQSIIPWSFAKSTGGSGYCQQYFELIGGIVWEPWFGESEDEVLLRKALRKRDPAIMKWYWDWLAGKTSGGFDMNICLGLKSEFIKLTMPKVLALMRKIIELYISGETWERIVLGLRGGGSKHGDSGTEGIAPAD